MSSRLVLLIESQDRGFAELCLDGEPFMIWQWAPTTRGYALNVSDSAVTEHHFARRTILRSILNAAHDVGDVDVRCVLDIAYARKILGENI